MDPITFAVTTILGKYAIDKGATLIKEAGQAAADAAAKLFQKVIDRLKSDPAEARNADRFEKEPVKHQELMGEVIGEQVKADPDFAAELQTLVDEFNQASGQAIYNIGRDYQQINAKQVIQMQNNYGPITGDDAQITTNRSGGTDISASQVDIDGDVTGRDKKQSS